MRIDKTQQNSKCRLCGDRDETINHIISECSKLAQKEYKARHDWIGKVIHWEMCRKFQFDHTNKWNMHNPAPVLENDSHKLLWDFNIQTDHLIPARRPDLIIINKRKRICKIVDFAVPADHKINLKESEKKDTYVFNNAVVWMVSTRSPTSKSSRPFNNPLVTVPKAPITIGIIVTFVFFFNSLARSRYLSLFSHSFSIILWSARTVKSTILQIFFSLLIIIRSSLLAEIRWSVCISKSHRSLWASFF